MIYNAVYDAWRHCLSHARFDTDQIVAFQNGVAGAHWLFDEDAVLYIEGTFWQLLIDMEMAHAYVEGARDAAQETRTEQAENKARIFKLMVAQEKVIEQVFKPYLKLRH